MNRPLISLAIGIAATVIMPALAQAEPCEITLPYGWNRRGVTWTGGCEAGMASGPGVMRYVDDGRTDLFFGTFAQGWAVRGASEGPDGFRAFRFSNGRLIQDEPPSLQAEALRIGADAAEGAAERLRQSGDRWSAKTYSDKAKALREQAQKVR